MPAAVPPKVPLADDILALLAATSELYPTEIAAALAAQGRAVEGLRPTLEMLFATRRVARLWHRYCLPDDVEAVRAGWLAALDRVRPQLSVDTNAARLWEDTRAAIERWDGWSLG